MSDSIVRLSSRSSIQTEKLEKYDYNHYVLHKVENSVENDKEVTVLDDPEIGRIVDKAKSVTMV